MIIITNFIFENNLLVKPNEICFKADGMPVKSENESNSSKSVKISTLK